MLRAAKTSCGAKRSLPQPKGRPPLKPAALHEDLNDLQVRLAYTFKDAELLARALTHRSFANEHVEAGLRDNERLEFLGDAVLGLVVGEGLMRTFDFLSEGELSKMRSILVAETSLAERFRKLGGKEYLRLGHGEARTGGGDKASIQANTYEAIVAAIYLDGGFEAARDFVRREFEAEFDRIFEKKIWTDSKTRLQELLQAMRGATPTYGVVAETGPDHDKTFEAVVLINDVEHGRGKGKSKKEAEQAAAMQALERISKPA